ncbi:MAG: DNA polymerase IV [Bermanella sp.]
MGWLGVRQVLHVDCDCFFAAVEMRDQPKYKDVPIAIGGASDRRGVISTCNYPARKYGVRSAMASSQALKLCPNLILLPGNMEKYHNASAQVMDVLKQYAVSFEPVSVDEAFIELPVTSDAEGVSRQIRQQILSEVGITVSVGIAPNKFLAKIASDWNKPDGQFRVSASEVDGFVARLPVKLIPGVGPKSAEKLGNLGIHTCQDVRDVPPEWLKARLGKFGEILIQRAHGEDVRQVKIRGQRKSISIEHTFPSDLNKVSEIGEALHIMWPKFLERVQRAQLKPENLAPFVKVKFADFHVTTLAKHNRKVNFEDYLGLLYEASQRDTQSIRLLGIGAKLLHGATSSQQLNLPF